MDAIIILDVIGKVVIAIACKFRVIIVSVVSELARRRSTKIEYLGDS